MIKFVVNIQAQKSENKISAYLSANTNRAGSLLIMITWPVASFVILSVQQCNDVMLSGVYCI